MSCDLEYGSFESPNDTFAPDLNYAVVHGKIINRATQKGVPEIDVLLFDCGIWDCDLIGQTKSGQNGNFVFLKGGKIDLRGQSYSNLYQKGAWVNGSFNSNFSGANAIQNQDTVQEINIELYPETHFTIHLSSKNSIAVSDTLKINVENGRAQDGFDNSRKKEFEFIGHQSNTIIKGKTMVGNILTINYELINDSGTERYSKIVDCIPGGLTEIKIDY